MKVKLLRDLYEHRDGKVIRHLAGTEPDLSKEVADVVIRSVIAQRERIRALAQKCSWTPEGRR